jgi:hypothetical protein
MQTPNAGLDLYRLSGQDSNTAGEDEISVIPLWLAATSNASAWA